MKRAGWIVGALVVACGGGSPEPSSPADDSDYFEDDSSIGLDDESSPSDDEGGGAEDVDEPAGVSAETTDEDVQKILQLVIDDEALQQYLNLGEPGRFPFKIAGEVPSGLELKKGEKPVEFVSGPEDDKDPVFQITELDVDGKKASVKFRYDIENLRGSAYLEKGEYGWELTSSRHIQR